MLLPPCFLSVPFVVVLDCILIYTCINIYEPDNVKITFIIKTITHSQMHTCAGSSKSSLYSHTQRACKQMEV